MTKQHFQAFARLIRAEADYKTREAMIQLVSEVASEFNPRFDAVRFYEACQPKPEPEEAGT